MSFPGAPRAAPGTPRPGPRRVAGRVAIVPAAILEDAAISRPARWLYALLRARSDRQGWCWFSVSKLARSEGVARSTVQLWVNEVIAHGLVARRIERAGRASRYLMSVTVLRDPEDR